MYFTFSISFLILLTRGYAYESDNENVFKDQSLEHRGNKLKSEEPFEPGRGNILILENSFKEIGYKNDSTVATGTVNQDIAQPSIYSWLRGTVPYYIDKDSYGRTISIRIRMAMNIIESASCVVFKKINTANSSTWLHLTNPQKERDCVHETKIGSNGERIMTIGYDCMQLNDILHALLHVLGFKDEVTHPQRDSYVRILWQNIQPRYRHLFQIQNFPPAHQHLAEYDTMSIMHFHDRAFTINGAATIAPLIPGLLINPSDSLSILDKLKLRLVYGQECTQREVDSVIEACNKTLFTISNEEILDTGDGGAENETDNVKDEEDNGTEASDDENDDVEDEESL